MANSSFFLASKSPRRQALLEQIGIRFEVIDIEVDEARGGPANPLTAMCCA